MRIFVFGFIIGSLVLAFFVFAGFPKVAKMVIVSQPQEQNIWVLSDLRDLAIAKSVKEGNYRCCINPPCTMCFWEGNRWNNNTPGTCDCDSLIAKGEEPCPQCARAIQSGQCGSSGAQASPVCSPK